MSTESYRRLVHRDVLAGTFRRGTPVKVSSEGCADFRDCKGHVVSRRNTRDDMNEVQLDASDKPESFRNLELEELK